jgi:hypothetical protein
LQQFLVLMALPERQYGLEGSIEVFLIGVVVSMIMGRRASSVN